MKRTIWTFESIKAAVREKPDEGNVLWIIACDDARRKSCEKKKLCARLLDSPSKAFKYCRKISIEVKEEKKS